MKTSPVDQIKQMLHLDYHLCPQCGWEGKQKQLLLTESKKSTICPDCQSLQFSMKDPTLVQRVESAESHYHQVLSKEAYDKPQERSLQFLSRFINSYSLDEDGANEFFNRIKRTSDFQHV